MVNVTLDVKVKSVQRCILDTVKIEVNLLKIGEKVRLFLL